MALEHLIWRIKLTKGIPELIALGAGAYKGYCDSQGILINPKIIDVSLIVAPPIIHTGTGGYLGLMESVGDEDNTKHAALIVKRSMQGYVIGAIETGLGYCIGYAIGSLSR